MDACCHFHFSVFEIFATELVKLTRQLERHFKIHCLKRGNTVGEPRSNYNAGYSNKNAAIIFETTSSALLEMEEHFGNPSTHSSPHLQTPLYASPQIHSSTILKIKLRQSDNLRKTPQCRTFQLYRLLSTRYASSMKSQQLKSKDS